MIKLVIVSSWIYAWDHQVELPSNKVLCRLSEPKVIYGRKYSQDLISTTTAFFMMIRKSFQSVPNRLASLSPSMMTPLFNLLWNKITRRKKSYKQVKSPWRAWILITCLKFQEYSSTKALLKNIIERFLTISVIKRWLLCPDWRQSDPYLDSGWCMKIIWVVRDSFVKRFRKTEKFIS